MITIIIMIIIIIKTFILKTEKRRLKGLKDVQVNVQMPPPPHIQKKFKISCGGLSRSKC